MVRGVALGGFMGVGKSSVGRALSKSLGLPFVDLDEMLVGRYGEISRQFEEVGEDTFRERETRALAAVAAGPPCVLATGGGAWVSEKNQTILSESFHRVVLTASLDVLRQRVGRGETRPLWDSQVEERLEARRNAYRKADFVVETSTLSVNQVVSEIMVWLR